MVFTLSDLVKSLTGNASRSKSLRYFPLDESEPLMKVSPGSCLSDLDGADSSMASVERLGLKEVEVGIIALDV